MEKYKLIKKGYKINFNKIEEGYLASEVVISAKTRNEARSLLSAKIYYESWKLKYSDKDVSYLNIPIKRAEEHDIVLFQGKEIARYKVEQLLREKERSLELDKILDNKDVVFCYIVKGGYYYKPNSCGYTSFQSRAGVYEKSDAVKDAKMCDELWVRPIDIEEHNRIINKEIEILQQGLIKI